MDLDHVAIAMRDVGDALNTLVGELGGTILFGGPTVGFRAMQVFVGDGSKGMQIELLEPWQVEVNDFLERFLVKHGDGPHHLTFKVADLAAEVERVRKDGFDFVGIDLEHPLWKEAFIHPKQAHGTVVQLAQSAWQVPTGDMKEFVELRRAAGPRGPFEGADRRWWPDPPPRAEKEASMERVVVATPNLEETADFFGRTLRGDVHESGNGWVELRWPGGGRIRLEERQNGARGIDRLECVHDGPPSERIVGGARLVLSPR